MSTRASSSSSSSAPKKLMLVARDGVEFEVEEQAAIMSLTIKNMIEEGIADVIPLPNVDSPTLAKVVGFWNHRLDLKRRGLVEGDDVSGAAPADKKGKRLLGIKKRWDKKFLDMDENEVYDVLMAADYLDDPKLMALVCQDVANFMTNMSVEEVRDFFGLENDFTSLEERQLLRSIPKWLSDN